VNLDFFLKTGSSSVKQRMTPSQFRLSQRFHWTLTDEEVTEVRSDTTKVPVSCYGLHGALFFMHIGCKLRYWIGSLRDCK